MTEIHLQNETMLSEALRCILSSPTVSTNDEFHPALDIAFLEAFVADALTEEQLEAYRTHLAECPLCQEAMAVQAKAGNLDDPFQPPILDVPAVAHKRSFVKRLVVLACCLLVLASVGFIVASTLVKTPTTPQVVALGPSVTEPIVKLVPEPAAEELAVSEPVAKGLSQAEFPALDTPARTALLAMLTPQDVPQTLTLNQLGFWPNGQMMTKDLANASPEDQKKVEAFQRAIAEDSSNVKLVLDYITFLLFTVDDVELAEPLVKDLGTKSLSEPQKLRWNQLRGTMAFQLEDYPQAIEAFQTVASQTQDPLDRLNLATALYAAGQQLEACALLTELKAQIQDEKIQKQIETVLKFSNQGENEDE